MAAPNCQRGFFLPFFSTAIFPVPALPSVLADANAAAVLAQGAPPPVLADVAAAAVLASAALSSVVAKPKDSCTGCAFQEDRASRA